MTLTWYPLDRQELPRILVGEGHPSGFGQRQPSPVRSDVLLGMASPEHGEEPVVAVALVGSSRSEIFSWVSTYAEEMFPLTQFCRVCSFEDWTELGLDMRKEFGVGGVHPIWPSLVLGEMLGQSEADLDVAGAPLARAAASYSFAVARTAFLYPHDDRAEAMCIRRLKMAESDSRFGRRPIAVGMLERAWSVALSLRTVAPESFNFLETVIKVVEAVDGEVAHLLNRVPFLMSDSAEDRVVGFDVVADTLLNKNTANSVGREGGAVALAAACLLAGRGTSHIQLLAPATKVFPETLVWYGLLAGVLGPRGWDKAWMQQSKRIERTLRQLFRPDEPGMADICWPEYEWLSRTYDSLEVFSSIPKSAPRSLVIELLPGVSSHFRLVGQPSNIRGNDERRYGEAETKGRISPVPDGAIARAVELLSQVQRLLQPSGSSEPTQGTFLDNDSAAKQDRQARRKSSNKQFKAPSE